MMSCGGRASRAAVLVFLGAARDGVGVGQIEAARGRLAHAVELNGEKVSRCSILAPTEWNFYPEGAAARGLARIAERGGKHCADLARLFVTAVDPCVGADVESTDARDVPCQGMVQIIEEQAKAHAYARVKTVRLEIGPLAAVEPEALRFCFDAATRGTVAENAKLEIITTAASAWCFSCGETVTISERNGVCPNCGSYQVQVTAGDELRIKELEVD